MDGATFELSPQASTIPRSGDGLRAFTGPETLYTLNIRRGALTQADPATLASWSGGLQPPAGQIRPQATIVDGSGAEHATRSNVANAVTSPSTNLLTSSSTVPKIHENPPPSS